MDLLDFTDCKLYFEDPLPPRAVNLLSAAADAYGEPEAELCLLRAHLLAPENLTILVGLYRFYFYQHRLEDALQIAERAMHLAARHLSLPPDWRQIDEHSLAIAAACSFGLLRFYLIAMKASCVVLLRLRRIGEARQRLERLGTFDTRDQLGAARLLEVIDQFQNPPAVDHDAFNPALAAA